MTPDDRQRLKRKLLAKGQELATMLSALLEGQKPSALDLLDAEPGETDEEKLRRYLDLVQTRLDAIAAGTYGRCESCGREIPVVELDEGPLADRCRACAGAT